MFAEVTLKKPDFSVIIPTFNGADKILDLLRSLEKQTTSNFEIIVVIDGSTDNTKDQLKSFQNSKLKIKTIFQENKGRAITRNNGVAHAQHELLLFFDDDMRMSSRAIEYHLDHHSKIDDTILVGNQIEDLELMKTDMHHYKRHLSLKWMSELAKSYQKLDNPFITAANFSISKTTFQLLGGFDERLTDCEDYDLALRAKNKNIDIYFNPNIYGWHDDFITAVSYLKRLKEYKEANFELIKINPLAKISQTKITLFKYLIYFLFSFDFWIKIIDKEWSQWIPKKIRYKLYGIVFHSQSNIFNNE